MAAFSFNLPGPGRAGTLLTLALAAGALFNAAWLAGRFGEALHGPFWTALFLTGAGLSEIAAGLDLRLRRSGYRAAIWLAWSWAFNLTGLLSILARLGYPEHLVYLISGPNLKSPVWQDAVFFSGNLGFTFLLTFYVAGWPGPRPAGRGADYWSALLILAGSGLSLYMVIFSGGLLAGAGRLDLFNLAFALNLLLFSATAAILFLKAVRPKPF